MPRPPPLLSDSVKYWLSVYFYQQDKITAECTHLSLAVHKAERELSSSMRVRRPKNAKLHIEKRGADRNTIS